MRLEPEWWGECRALQAQGVSWRQIALRLKKSIGAVHYCLSQGHRERHNQRSSERQRRLRGQGIDTGGGEFTVRHKVRRQVRMMLADDGGGTPEDLRVLYRKYDCL